MSIIREKSILNIYFSASLDFQMIIVYSLVFCIYNHGTVLNYWVAIKDEVIIVCESKAGGSIREGDQNVNVCIYTTIEGNGNLEKGRKSSIQLIYPYRKYWFR